MKQTTVGIGPYVDITAVAGASNVSTITLTVKDADGQTVAEPMNLMVWCSDAIDGAGHTAETPSGDITAVTGTMLGASLVTKVCWQVQTATTGIFVGSFTDTGVPTAGFYMCVQDPRTGMVSVSDVLVAANFG